MLRIESFFEEFLMIYFWEDMNEIKKRVNTESVVNKRKNVNSELGG